MLSSNRNILDSYNNSSRVPGQLTQLLGDARVSTPTQSDNSCSFTTWDSAPQTVAPTRSAVYDQVAPSSDLYQTVSKPPGNNMTGRSTSSIKDSSSNSLDTLPPPLPPRDYKDPSSAEQVNLIKCLDLSYDNLLHNFPGTT